MANSHNPHERRKARLKRHKREVERLLKRGERHNGGGEKPRLPARGPAKEIRAPKTI
jgi:hypothetical protein